MRVLTPKVYADAGVTPELLDKRGIYLNFYHTTVFKTAIKNAEQLGAEIGYYDEHEMKFTEIRLSVKKRCRIQTA